MNKPVMFLLILLLMLFTCDFISFAQEDIQIGSSLKNQQSQGGLYDYSDPETVNITVLVWGFVKYPGQYIIPAYSNINNLIALAGGPTDDANLEDLRLFRINKDSSQTMIKFDYDDLLWNDDLTKQVKIPNIQAGDILLVPGEPRFYFKDYFSLALSIVGTIVAIITLSVTLSN